MSRKIESFDDITATDWVMLALVAVPLLFLIYIFFGGWVSGIALFLLIAGAVSLFFAD